MVAKETNGLSQISATSTHVSGFLSDPGTSNSIAEPNAANAANGRASKAMTPTNIGIAFSDQPVRVGSLSKSDNE